MSATISHGFCRDAHGLLWIQQVDGRQYASSAPVCHLIERKEQSHRDSDLASSDNLGHLRRDQSSRRLGYRRLCAEPSRAAPRTHVHLHSCHTVPAPPTLGPDDTFTLHLPHPTPFMLSAPVLSSTPVLDIVAFSGEDTDSLGNQPSCRYLLLSRLSLPPGVQLNKHIILQTYERLVHQTSGQTKNRQTHFLLLCSINFATKNGQVLMFCLLQLFHRKARLTGQIRP